MSSLDICFVGSNQSIKFLYELLRNLNYELGKFEFFSDLSDLDNIEVRMRKFSKVVLFLSQEDTHARVFAGTDGTFSNFFKAVAQTHKEESTFLLVSSLSKELVPVKTEEALMEYSSKQRLAIFSPDDANQFAEAMQHMMSYSGPAVDIKQNEKIVPPSSNNLARQAKEYDKVSVSIALSIVVLAVVASFAFMKLDITSIFDSSSRCENFDLEILTLNKTIRTSLSRISFESSQLGNIQRLVSELQFNESIARSAYESLLKVTNQCTTHLESAIHERDKNINASHDMRNYLQKLEENVLDLNETMKTTKDDIDKEQVYVNQAFLNRKKEAHRYHTENICRMQQYFMSAGENKTLIVNNINSCKTMLSELMNKLDGLQHDVQRANNSLIRAKSNLEESSTTLQDIELQLRENGKKLATLQEQTSQAGFELLSVCYKWEKYEQKYVSCTPKHLLPVECKENSIH